MKKIFAIGIGVIVCVWFFSVPIAKADYTSGFESLIASAGGTLLPPQDGFYQPTSGYIDYNVYTYSGNTLSFPSNANGGSNFVSGTGGQVLLYARTQRDVSFGTGGIWTISYDLAAKYLGTGPSANNVGSFSLQPTAVGNSDYIQVMSWVNPETPTNYNAFYLAYDSGGTQFSQPGASPGPAWENLAVNHWYHAWTTFDFDINRILEVGITDLETLSTSTFNPTDWYLGGGAGGSSSLPTSFRFFSGGGTNPNNYSFMNTMAFDNISIQPVPEPATMLLLGSGLVGLAGYARKRFKK